MRRTPARTIASASAASGVLGAVRVLGALDVREHRVAAADDREIAVERSVVQRRASVTARVSKRCCAPSTRERGGRDEELLGRRAGERRGPGRCAATASVGAVDRRRSSSYGATIPASRRCRFAAATGCAEHARGPGAATTAVWRAGGAGRASRTAAVAGAGSARAPRARHSPPAIARTAATAGARRRVRRARASGGSARSATGVRARSTARFADG